MTKSFLPLLMAGLHFVFSTPECCTIAGLACKPQDTIMELGNGTKALSRGIVQGAPITLAGLMIRTDFIVSRLLHDCRFRVWSQLGQGHQSLID